MWRRRMRYLRYLNISPLNWQNVKKIFGYHFFPLIMDSKPLIVNLITMDNKPTLRQITLIVTFFLVTTIVNGFASMQCARTYC